MERRKFLVGMGSLAAGSAAAMGTGAFSSVSASRTVSVKTTDDASAYLQMTPSGSPNGEYAAQNGGEIVIGLNNTDDGGGAGLNKNAETGIGKIVRVQNEGTQAVQVYVPPESVSDRVRPDPDDDGNKEYAKQGTGNADSDDGNPNDIYMDIVSPADGGMSLTGIYGVFTPENDPDYFDGAVLGPGQSLQLGLFFRVREPPRSLDVSFDIDADADLGDA